MNLNIYSYLDAVCMFPFGRNVNFFFSLNVLMGDYGESSLVRRVAGDGFT